VYSILGLGNEPLNFIKPNVAAIVDFKRATRNETAVEYREDNGIQNWGIVIVKRAVDEYA
jgi:hypothetical protein